MKAFWISRPWHHLRHKDICEEGKMWLTIRVNLTHLVWTPHLTSALATKYRQEVSLTADWTFLCPSPSIPESAVPFLYVPLYIGFMSWVLLMRSNTTAPPWNRLCFSSASSYEILISGKIASPPWWNVSALLHTVSAITGIRVTHFLFFFVWSSNAPVSCLTAGDLADLPSVCPGEDSGSGEPLDMFWLEMTLARDTKRRGRSRRK